MKCLSLIHWLVEGLLKADVWCIPTVHTHSVGCVGKPKLERGTRGVAKYGWGVAKYGWGITKYGWGVAKYGWGVAKYGWGVA